MPGCIIFFIPHTNKSVLNLFIEDNKISLLDSYRKHHKDINTRDILFDKKILYQQHDNAVDSDLSELVTQLQHYVDDICAYNTMHVVLANDFVIREYINLSHKYNKLALDALIDNQIEKLIPLSRSNVAFDYVATHLTRHNSINLYACNKLIIENLQNIASQLEMRLNFITLEEQILCIGLQQIFQNYINSYTDDKLHFSLVILECDTYVRFFLLENTKKLKVSFISQCKIGTTTCIEHDNLHTIIKKFNITALLVSDYLAAYINPSILNISKPIITFCLADLLQKRYKAICNLSLQRNTLLQQLILLALKNIY